MRSTPIYYGQFEQDRFLSEQIFLGKKGGFFVDVGAHDGVTFSNTCHFERFHQWTGINIEPITSVFDKLQANRPNSVNLNCAISDVDGPVSFLLNTGYTEMLSGIVSNYDPRHLKRIANEQARQGGFSTVTSVPGRRLASIFRDQSVKHIDLVSIDVEGAELTVLKSIDFEQTSIDVICVEDNYPSSSSELIDFMSSKGFRIFERKGDIFFASHSFTLPIYYK